MNINIFNKISKIWLMPIMVFTLLILAACNGGGGSSGSSNNPPSSAKAITDYKIGNSSGIINGQNITVNMPYNTNVESLIATFTISGQKVTVKGVEQKSGVTANDFTNQVEYIVTAMDGSTTKYYVKVIVGLISSNEITSYSINGESGVIAGNNITVTLPSGTNVTALKAEFSTTGTSVLIGDVLQTSGVTANDFTNPIAYTVVAANGNRADYVVTVIISSSSTKIFTDFAFNQTNGIIDNNAHTIKATLPKGTNNLSNLTVTFNYQGSKVMAGGKEQISGQTNDFSGGSVVYTVYAEDGSSSVDYTVSVEALTGSTVFGWPDYVAMGTVTTNVCTLNSDPAQSCNDEDPQTVDAVFKYSGSDGKGNRGYIPYPGATLGSLKFVGQMAIKEPMDERPVRPVMVEYTANFSKDGATDGTTDFTLDNMSKHFINLAMDTTMLLKAAKTWNSQPVYGSIVLSPDGLGEIEKGVDVSVSEINNTLQSQGSDAVNAAVARVYCFMNLQVSWNNQTFWIPGQGYGIQNGTPPQIAINVNGTYTPDPSDPSSGTWPADAWYSQPQAGNGPACSSITTRNTNLPNFSNDFKGWVQANNWLIKYYGNGKITFGWQENLWATGNSDWVRNIDAYASDAASKIATAASTPILNFLNSQQVYTGAYTPDFLVLDRYEYDDTQAISAGWFFNDAAWSNLLTFAGQMSGGFIPGKNVPIMLWQMPGGHMQTNLSPPEPDMRNSNGATLTNYLFGDSNLIFNGSSYNLKSYWNSLPTLPSANYPSCPGCTPMTYLLKNGYDWSKDQGNMKRLAESSHVFSILWGGGNTTGVNSIPSGPGSDGHWLANKIINYYKSPQPVK